MTDKDEIRVAFVEMRLFRQHLKEGYGEEGYKEQLQMFTNELRKLERPPGVNYIEAATIVQQRIEQNPELRQEAKEIGCAMYYLAAVELMGEDKFIEWMLN
ncbi:hypothetical protein [Spirosoma oryzicola]|uniref:hypothetical protein n=1 Tax=Spirosoma oryzicola TaxID=2898794 RepID=UPI001E52BEC8|nr:hypothetical protein [Spirosoma oryzicola]UHG90093.1 hypothetical protein LQ777_17795 [Spirosoma oryzicola]